MMADITFRQGDFEGALNLYNELLTRDPSKQSFVLFVYIGAVCIAIQLYMARATLQLSLHVLCVITNSILFGYDAIC